MRSHCTTSPDETESESGIDKNVIRFQIINGQKTNHGLTMELMHGMIIPIVKIVNIGPPTAPKRLNENCKTPGLTTVKMNAKPTVEDPMVAASFQMCKVCKMVR